MAVAVAVVCCGSAISATVGCGIVAASVIGNGLLCLYGDSVAVGVCVVLVAFYVPSVASCGRWCVCVVLVAFYVPSVASCGRCAALCVGVRGSVAVAVCGTGSVLRSQRCQLWPLPLLWFCHRQRSVVACMVIVWPLVRVVAVVVLVAFYIPSVARVRVLWFCHRQRSVVACMVVALPAVAVLPLLWFYYRQQSVVPVW